MYRNRLCAAGRPGKGEWPGVWGENVGERRIGGRVDVENETDVFSCENPSTSRGCESVAEICGMP